jgi:hypothetical protein
MTTAPFRLRSRFVLSPLVAAGLVLALAWPLQATAAPRKKNKPPVLPPPVQQAPAAAAPAAPEIVHDPAAAAELKAAFDALRAQPYRQRMETLEPAGLGDAQVIEMLGDGRMRMTQEQPMGEFPATAESLIVPGRAAHRVVSPAFDAHLAKLNARMRAAALISAGQAVRQILQGIATGGIGLLAAAESGLSLLGAARGTSGILDEDLYGKWQCVDLPAGMPVPGAPALAPAAEEERVERLPASEIDGEPVRGYRSATFAGGALLEHRSWVLESNGLPRRMEMSIEMPGFRSRSLTDFYDHGAAVEVEEPDCLRQPA